MRPPPAVRDSMERARQMRASPCRSRGCVCTQDPLREARMETREILRALKALRRQEEAGILAIVKA